MNNTKTCYLDANILVYFKEESLEQHGESVLLIQKLIEKQYVLAISPLCLDEFLYASTLYLKTAKVKDAAKELKKYLKDILNLPNLIIINPSTELQSHLKVISYMERYNLKPRDAYHLFIMKSNNVKYFSTFDGDFDIAFEKKAIKKFELE